MLFHMPLSYSITTTLILQKPLLPHLPPLSWRVGQEEEDKKAWLGRRRTGWEARMDKGSSLSVTLIV